MSKKDQIIVEKNEPNTNTIKIACCICKTETETASQPGQRHGDYICSSCQSRSDRAAQTATLVAKAPTIEIKAGG